MILCFIVCGILVVLFSLCFAFVTCCFCNWLFGLLICWVFWNLLIFGCCSCFDLFGSLLVLFGCYYFGCRLMLLRMFSCVGFCLPFLFSCFRLLVSWFCDFRFACFDWVFGLDLLVCVLFAYSVCSCFVVFRSCYYFYCLCLLYL